MKLLLLIFCVWSGLLAAGQDQVRFPLVVTDSTPGIFSLGEVVVNSGFSKQAATTISSGKIQQFGKTDVAKASSMYRSIKSLGSFRWFHRNKVLQINY